MSLDIRIARWVVAIFCTTALVYLMFGGYKLWKWDAYWFPSYLQQQIFNEDKSAEIKHLMFVVVDHYEPGFDKEEAIQASEKWLGEYKKAVKGKYDSYGNRFVYNWFYPFDQKHDQVLQRLQAEVKQGAGEIELHWHKPCLTKEEYQQQLSEAVSWFNKAGAFKAKVEVGVEVNSQQPDPKSRFVFIAGNWDLDNGRGTGCGIDNEITQLEKAGGYMDMTYSTVGAPAQPIHMINQLYYVEDTDEAKSYEQGIRVKVGKAAPERPFLMFQGPLSFHWDLSFEYGALESYALPSLKRIKYWLDSHIHVENKPEWSFVKLYSHGIQSPGIVKHHLGPMLDQLKVETERRGIKLHYVSAREAYNIVRAAEAGLTGDPEQYRDYIHASPI